MVLYHAVQSVSSVLPCRLYQLAVQVSPHRLLWWIKHSPYASPALACRHLRAGNLGASSTKVIVSGSSTLRSFTSAWPPASCTAVHSLN